MWLSDFAWGTGARKTITSITITAGMITAVAAAAPTVEPWIAAHRGYVREYADGLAIAKIQEYKLAQAEVKRTVSHIQRELAEGKREATISDLAKWKLELTKSHDDVAQQLIADQVRRLEETRFKLDKQIETLDKP